MVSEPCSTLSVMKTVASTLTGNVLIAEKMRWYHLPISQDHSRTQYHHLQSFSVLGRRQMSAVVAISGGAFVDGIEWQKIRQNITADVDPTIATLQRTCNMKTCEIDEAFLQDEREVNRKWQSFLLW